MAKTYKIGDKTIDVEQLIAIGNIRNEWCGLIYLPLIFQFNSNVDVCFVSGENGAPEYHNSEGDWTEENSDFWRFAESEKNKLIEVWQEIKSNRTYDIK